MSKFGAKPNTSKSAFASPGMKPTFASTQQVAKKGPPLKTNTPQKAPVNTKPVVNAKPVVTPKPVIPKAPTGGPKPNPTVNSGKMIDDGEKAGGHARDRHVGKSDSYLAGRGKGVATSYLTKSDQNKAVTEMLGTKDLQKKMNKLGTKPNNTTSASDQPTPIGKGGPTWNKTAPITRVVKDGQAFNAKATQNKVELLKTGGKVNIHSAFATTPKGGFTPLEKPASGPNLKPTTKANVSMKDGAVTGLRSVPKPTDKPLPKSTDKDAWGEEDDLKRVTAGAKKK